jgi:hypothetical protein
MTPNFRLSKQNRSQVSVDLSENLPPGKFWPLRDGREDDEKLPGI